MNICKWNSTGKKMFTSGRSRTSAVCCLCCFIKLMKNLIVTGQAFSKQFTLFIFFLCTLVFFFFSATSQRSSRRQRETRHSGEQHLVPFVMIRSTCEMEWYSNYTSAASNPAFPLDDIPSPRVQSAAALGLITLHVWLCQTGAPINYWHQILCEVLCSGAPISPVLITGSHLWWYSVEEHFLSCDVPCFQGLMVGESHVLNHKGGWWLVCNSGVSAASVSDPSVLLLSVR